MKKIVLVVALTFCVSFVSCKNKEETPAEEITTEEIVPEVMDSIKNDSVAPMVEPKDSVSPK